MASNGGGSRPYLGSFFLVAGAGLLTLGFLPGAMVSLPVEAPSVAGVPGNLLVLAGSGIVFLAAGTQLLRGASSSTPTYNTQEVSQTSQGRSSGSQPSPNPTGTTVDRSGPKQGEQPATKEEQQMESLQDKIDAIDRRMSQAKVKLGTGELSPEGYQKVMEELQEKRAKLEKQRVDLELDQSDI